MDKEVLRQEVMQQAMAAVEQAMAVVERAPDGQWISGSEWQVREIFQKLMSQSYQRLLQSRIDAHPTASQAAFFPFGQSEDSAQQRGTRAEGAQRRR